MKKFESTLHLTIVKVIGPQDDPDSIVIFDTLLSDKDAVPVLYDARLHAAIQLHASTLPDYVHGHHNWIQTRTKLVFCGFLKSFTLKGIDKSGQN